MIEFTNLEQVLKDYIEDVQKNYKDKLRRDGHVSSGDLINTMKCEIIVDDTCYIAQLTLQDYWKYLETGTKPHFPPIKSILKWIEQKPVIPREVNGIKPNNEQLAYLIGRKISRDGTKGGLQLSETIEELNAMWLKRIEDALEKDILISLEEVIPIIQ